MQFSQFVENLKAAVSGHPHEDDLDQDMKRVLDAHAALGAKPLDTLSVEEARKQPTLADAVKKVLATDGEFPPPSSVASRDIAIPGAAGELHARVYRPAGNGPFPVVLYFHGGGFVIADLDTYDATPRSMARKVNAVFVSVHYRQAPENPFPAAHEDAWAAYRWLLENAETLEGSPDRIAVMGESAGGNLAINVSIRARDENVQMPVQQTLIYPLVATDMDTPSYLDTKHSRPLNKAGMKWFADKIFADAKDKDSLLINVVEADLSRLPPTAVITAGVDPLRSEDETLEIRLQGQGTEVACRNYAGATHEFFGMAAAVHAAREAQDFVAEQMSKAFARKLH